MLEQLLQEDELSGIEEKNLRRRGGGTIEREALGVERAPKFNDSSFPNVPSRGHV